MIAGLGCACLQEVQGLLFPASREDSSGTWFSEVTLVLKCSVCIGWDGGNRSAMCDREGVARSKLSLPTCTTNFRQVCWEPLAIPETAALQWQYLRISSLKTRAGLELCCSRSSWRPLTYLGYSFGLKAPLLSGCQCATLGGRCVRWPLLGQSWLSWCCEAPFPQSWVNMWQWWKTPGAWLKAEFGPWFQEPFGVKRQPEITWGTGAAACLLLIRLKAALDCSFWTFCICLPEQVCLAV